MTLESLAKCIRMADPGHGVEETEERRQVIGFDEVPARLAGESCFGVYSNTSNVIV